VELFIKNIFPLRLDNLSVPPRNGWSVAGIMMSRVETGSIDSRLPILRLNNPKMSLKTCQRTRKIDGQENGEFPNTA
jgi:hypothetical protein